jgi:hypothetical protein
MISGEPPQSASNMQAWEDLVPGSASRLFDEYILQLRHRRRIDSSDAVLAFFGPVLGFLVVLAFLGTAAWLIHTGFRIEGTVLGSVDIVSLAAVFVVGADRKRAAGGTVRVSAEALPEHAD